jgi:hypothetical protein
MFLSGRNPRTMADYGQDLDDLAGFLGTADRRRGPGRESYLWM